MLATVELLFLLFTEDAELFKQLTVVKPIVSSAVCRQCLSSNSSGTNIWLTWLTCIDSCHSKEYVTVVRRQKWAMKELVPVCELTDQTLRPLHLAACKEGRGDECKTTNCVFAHSQEELDYRKWIILSERIYDMLQQVYAIALIKCYFFNEFRASSFVTIVSYKKNSLFQEFVNIRSKCSYPCETSVAVESVVTCVGITCDNYKEKFHKLVYLDNLEHARKMVVL